MVPVTWTSGGSQTRTALMVGYEPTELTPTQTRSTLLSAVTKWSASSQYKHGDCGYEHEYTKHSSPPISNLGKGWIRGCSPDRSNRILHHQTLFLMCRN